METNKNMNSADEVVTKNIILTGKVMKYLIEHPSLFDFLPDDFELVIVPEDDQELRNYNLDLLSHLGDEGKPVVFARLKAGNFSLEEDTCLNLYIPIPA